MRQSKLEEMWAALTAYQPQADAAGHGDSWAKMCKERTVAAARAATAAAAKADAEKRARIAIDRINKVLAAPVQQEQSNKSLWMDCAALADAIHYPDCWDTGAYPELDDALHELSAWFKVSGCTTCAPQPTQGDLAYVVNELRETARAFNEKYDSSSIADLCNKAATLLQSSAELVRADEREACAKVCDDYDDKYDIHTRQTIEGIAMQIRARGNT